MRWFIRAVAGLSVVSWMVVVGLFARPGAALSDMRGPTTLARAEGGTTAELPADWRRRVLAVSRDVFPGVDREKAEVVLPIVERQARRFRVDPLMVLAVIQVESRFDPAAVSDQGAVGLMQLQADTARELASDLGVAWMGDDQLFDPNVNVLLGCAYLRRLIDRFGDQGAALAAYCSGPTFVEARRDVNARIPLRYSDRVWDVWTALQSRVTA